ncbi:hypothetical protein AVEN_72022-1 [Araneus ventricosus]|uniref:Transposable element Tc3 transposase n=1 Tax=Araneus ventricosus TaxID=182803 RepID=A0A4Y2DGR1_ARAVE|nr:hypothetical protein AVEN_72022-1 [Araneus ventricosus]
MGTSDEVLPELLQDVPIAIRNRMWFQPDGASAHFSTDMRNYQNATFEARWIGRGGPVPWPPRSPDLLNLDYFLWGYLESIVYETPVDSDEDLVARISVAAASVRKIPGIYECVRQSLHRRCQACITFDGRKFEQLLQTLYLSTTLSINTTYFLSSLISCVCASPRHLRPYIRIQ